MSEPKMTEMDAWFRRMLSFRRLEASCDERVDPEPCRGCSGFGVRTYPSTSTWHGGVGGMTMTAAICDRCWGSGINGEPWVSLRGYQGLIKRAEHAEARLAKLEEAARELLHVADLRGDADLPHPADDPQLWTARMQEAWNDLRAVLDKEADNE